VLNRLNPKIFDIGGSSSSSNVEAVIGPLLEEGIIGADSSFGGGGGPLSMGLVSGSGREFDSGGFLSRLNLAGRSSSVGRR